MLRKILTVAIFAGVLSGLGISAVQEFTTTPLIMHAEEYENAAGPDAGPVGEPAHSTFVHSKFIPAAFILAHSDEAHEAADTDDAHDWAPANRFQRILSTVLANIITGVGFALLLVSCFVLHDAPMSGRRGVIWGVAGFAVVALGPGLGLPAELPGLYAADLDSRQVWWLGAAFCTGLGLWLMVFRQSWPMHVLGIAVITLPHLIGAPHPADVSGDVPPEISARFAAASLVTSAVFWAMLGWLSGTFYERVSIEGEQT